MAFSGSGMASGAAGGAMLGAKTGNPYVAAGGAVIGGAIGAFGGKKGTAPVRHQDWLENPQYDWTQPLLEKQAGFYSDELGRVQRGEAPAYWGGLESSIRDQQGGEVDRRYFGNPGDRGGSIMDSMMSAGAQTGIGPRGTNANVTKGLRDFSQERQSIENYITQLRAQEMQNAYNTIPKGINSLSEGPSGEWDNWTQAGTAGTNPGGDILGMGMQYGSMKMPSMGGGGAGISSGGMGGDSSMFGGSSFNPSSSYADLTRGSATSSRSRLGGVNLQDMTSRGSSPTSSPWSLSGSVR